MYNQIAKKTHENISLWLEWMAETDRLDLNFKKHHFSYLDVDIIEKIKRRLRNLMIKNKIITTRVTDVVAVLPLEGMKKVADDFKFSNPMKTALEVAVRLDPGLKVVKRSDIDDWDAQTAVNIANERDSIVSKRKERKAIKRIAKLKRRITATKRNVKDMLEVIKDPLFDESLYSLLIGKIMELGRNGQISRYDIDYLLPAIEETPFFNCNDLIMLRKVRSKYYNDYPFDTTRLHSSMAKCGDLNQKELKTLIKKANLETLLVILDKFDLNDVDKEDILERGVKKSPTNIESIKKLFDKVEKDYGYDDLWYRSILSNIYKKRSAGIDYIKKLKDIEEMCGKTFRPEVVKLLSKMDNPSKIIPDEINKIYNEIGIDVYVLTGKDTYITDEMKEFMLS